MSEDFSIIDFPKLRSLIESGSSGVVDVRADLERARAEIDWNAVKALLARPVEQTEAERWLTPEQAAEIAGVKVARIYEWSRGQKWAARPSRRCLRISEGAFRKWLATRTGGR